MLRDMGKRVLKMVQEWTVYDEEKQDFFLPTADNWKEAIVKAMDHGIKPRHVLHVRPRTGDANEIPLKKFNEFVK